MNFTKKEIKFLKEIHESEERGNPITFNYEETEKVKKYQKKYGDVYKTLVDAILFTGSICCGSTLNMTDKGKEELQKIDKKKDNRNQNRQKILIAIVSAIISSIISVFLTWLFTK